MVTFSDFIHRLKSLNHLVQHNKLPQESTRRYILNDQNLFHFKQKGHAAKKLLRGMLAPRLPSRSNDASLADTWHLVYLLCSGLN